MGNRKENRESTVKLRLPKHLQVWKRASSRLLLRPASRFPRHLAMPVIPAPPGQFPPYEQHCYCSSSEIRISAHYSRRKSSNSAPCLNSADPHFSLSAPRRPALRSSELNVHFASCQSERRRGGANHEPANRSWAARGYEPIAAWGGRGFVGMRVGKK
ncbi:hypothetical protein MHYP_G00184180 [Metynnis hypsauchen]